MEHDIAIRALFISKQEPFVINHDEGVMKRWLFATKANLGFAPRISMGVSSFSTGSRSTFYSDEEEIPREKACIVMNGIMKLSYKGGQGKVLSYRDCAYIPPNVDYEVENAGYSDLRVAWAIGPSLDSEVKPHPVGLDEPRVVRTLSEITPVKVTLRGLERSIYRIDYPTTFRFALFTRKAHTYSPLHTHDPKDFEEGYIVLSGSLKLTDQSGRSNLLHEGDFAYVPPYGGNLNENVSDDEVHYLWCGAPAVSMREIPVSAEHAKLSETMSLKKD